MRAVPVMERIDSWTHYEDRGYLTPCRIWRGHLSDGYGRIQTGYKHAPPVRMEFVHRVVWQHHHGPVPEGLQIDHLCRVRNCCEVTHLEVVTQSVNQRRGERPRLTREYFQSRTHCRHGHEYTPENTLVKEYYGHLHRYCRVCRREYDKRRVPRRRSSSTGAPRPLTARSSVLPPKAEETQCPRSPLSSTAPTITAEIAPVDSASRQSSADSTRTTRPTDQTIL